MIKLYKKDGEKTFYWEAWDAGDTTITVHWGTVGENGDSKVIPIPGNTTADDLIEKESQQARSRGYSPIATEDHIQVIVQHKTRDQWGDGGDLERRYLIEDLLNECLGWTGNGHCDGGDIGSGTINTFSFVVDRKIACDSIVEALRNANQLDGAVIAVMHDDEYSIHWPKNFEGEFTYF